MFLFCFVFAWGLALPGNQNVKVRGCQVSEQIALAQPRVTAGSLRTPLPQMAVDGAAPARARASGVGVGRGSHFSAALTAVLVSTTASESYVVAHSCEDKCKRRADNICVTQVLGVEPEEGYTNMFKWLFVPNKFAILLTF